MMCTEDKFKHLIEDAEAGGQKLIDDANLIDSWIVTFVIIREAIKYAKKAWAWLRRQREDTEE